MCDDNLPRHEKLGLKSFFQATASRLTGLSSERAVVSRLLEEVRSSLNSTIGWLPLIMAENSSGEPISPENAVRIATVYSCINFRADSVGMLPIMPYITKDDQQVVDRKHPAYKLLTCRPNPWMNPSLFLKLIVQITDLHGNCYVYITRDPRQRPIRLDLLNPWDMWLNSFNDDSVTDSPVYRYKGAIIPSTDIMHFKHFTRDGRLGISLISNHAETIGSAKKLRKFANRSVSSIPPIYGTTTSALPTSTTAKDQLKVYLMKEVADWFNRSEIPFLANGFDLKTVGLSPKDAQYLDQMSATKEDIFSIFKTPPGLIGSYKTGVTYSNMEQQELQWRAYGLTPLLKMIEEEFNEKLYTESEQESRFVKFNVKALLLTDHNAQANWFKTMFSIGVYSINDILRYLDMNPIPDGDDHYVPVNNLMPVDMVEDFLTNQEEAQPGDAATDLATGENDGPEKETKKRVRKYSIDELLKKKSITINVNGHAVEQ